MKPAGGTIKHMNHVRIFVPSVQKSVEFYQGLFGMPLLTKQEAGINLNCGVGFLGIYPAQGGATTGSINHLCFGLENFDADKVLKAKYKGGTGPLGDQDPKQATDKHRCKSAGYTRRLVHNVQEVSTYADTNAGRRRRRCHRRRGLRRDDQRSGQRTLGRYLETQSREIDL